MRLVVSDTGPINYLVLIGHADVLPLLFETVIIPEVVFRELTHPNAPGMVRAWITAASSWLEVHEEPAQSAGDDALRSLDDGERAAILLASSLHAELLLMDDREGVVAAQRRGLSVTGTIGVLYLAAQNGLLDLRTAFERLRQTSFRGPEEIMSQLVERYEREQA